MKKHFSILTIIIILVTGCAKNEIPPTASSPSTKSKTMNMTVSRDSNLVDSSMAAYLASYYNNDVFLKKGKSTTQRSISSAYSLPDKNGDPALYVFNYANNEGYIVISADFRYQPILSLAENGNITQKSTIPSMLGSWFGRMIENVEILRDGIYDNTAIGYHDWNDMMGGGYIPNNNIYPMPDDPGSGDYSGHECDPVDYTVGPLVQTTWGQDCGYNDLTPTCSTHACGHKPTGCVATAMAQVIKYWSPSNYFHYNYALMPNDNGTPTTAKLMNDAGLSVNMDYNCDESGANANDIGNALVGSFGFSWAGHSPYNGSNELYNIQSDLDDNKPVILDGCTAESSFLWWSWGSGECHVWVCDGYRRRGTTCAVDTWLHMNWGWNNGVGNNWTYVDDWQTTVYGVTYHFNYATGYTHNIHP